MRSAVIAGKKVFFFCRYVRGGTKINQFDFIFGIDDNILDLK